MLLTLCRKRILIRVSCLEHFDNIAIRNMGDSYHIDCDICRGELYRRGKEYYIVAEVIHIDEMLDAHGGSRGGWYRTVFEKEEIPFGPARPTREDIKQYYVARFKSES